MQNKFIIFLLLVVLASLSRLLPHLPNFTPIGALALFAGSYYAQRGVGLVLTIATLMITDLILGFHSTMIFVYGSFALIYLLSSLFLKSPFGMSKVVLMSFLSATLFYLVTNFGVWMMQKDFYPNTFSGLILCYEAGIPFFKNTLLGDLCYSTVLFGVYKFFEARQLQLENTKQ